MRKIIQKIVVVLLTASILMPSFGLASEIRLEPEMSEHNVDDLFILDVQFFGDECINAAGVEINYPQQILTGEDTITGSSIFELWPEGPEIDNSEGRVIFSGGIPGGICVEDKASLLEIVFRVGETSMRVTDKITVVDGQVYPDDGTGTALDAEFQDAYFRVIPERSAVPIDPWKERLQEDRLPPEEFDPEIRRDPSISDGKYVVVFSTVDRQTGIDYYKVSEVKRIGFIEVGEKQWEKTESPHLLEDQSLASIIRVKAVDRAGNKRVEEIHPPYGIWDYGPWVGLLVIVFVVIYLKKRKKKDLKIEWS